jgi:hypothetical protein
VSDAAATGAAVRAMVRPRANRSRSARARMVIPQGERSDGSLGTRAGAV